MCYVRYMCVMFNLCMLCSIYVCNVQSMYVMFNLLLHPESLQHNMYISMISHVYILFIMCMSFFMKSGYKSGSLCRSFPVIDLVRLFCKQFRYDSTEWLSMDRFHYVFIDLQIECKWFYIITVTITKSGTMFVKYVPLCFVPYVDTLRCPLLRQSLVTLTGWLLAN